MKKLKVKLVNEVKDIFGLYFVDVKINEKVYTFCISSEFALRKVKSLIRRHKPGKAINVLKLFNVREKEE